jgi:hypothetical protein
MPFKTLIDVMENKRFLIVHLRHQTHMIQCNTQTDKLNWIKNAEMYRKRLNLFRISQQLDYWGSVPEIDPMSGAASVSSSSDIESALGRLNSRGSTRKKNMECVQEEESIPESPILRKASSKDGSEIERGGSSKKGSAGSLLRKFASLTGLSKKKSDKKYGSDKGDSMTSLNKIE